MKLIEIVGDLFTSQASLAHCVSVDFHMGAGIAKDFRKLYPRHQAVLREGSWRIGDAARVQVGNRYMLYLVTKLYFFDKFSFAGQCSTFVKAHT